MAVIRRVQPANPISTFPATVRPGPSIFTALAEGMEAFGQHFDMLATEQAQRQGREQGAAAAGTYTPSNPGAAPGPLPRGGTAPGVTMTTPNELDPRGEVRTGRANRPIPVAGAGGTLPISGALEGVDEGLIQAAQQAWGYVMPPGSRIEVTTGVSSHSPNNHEPGRAIDFAVFRPDGSQVMWDDPEALQAAQFGRAMGVGGFGAGPEYMGGTHFHWDINDPRVWSDDDYTTDAQGNRVPTASTSGPGANNWSDALAEAERLGLEGLLAQAGVAPPVTSASGIAVASRSDSSDPLVATADGIAAEEGLDADLFRRVITQESNWDPSATSPRGARGLAQVMPDTAADPGYGVPPMEGDIDDPEANLRFGARYLSTMIDRYNGDVERALVAYNAGPRVADEWDGNRASLPTETQGYLENILEGEGGSVTASTSGEAVSGEVMEPQTAIRNEAGQLETRPLSIFTSRYDIIRQNAALGTYAAGVLNNASLAMADLRRQFPMDPDGFQQAAQGYVNRMMETAPAPIREQLLSDLQLEAGRTLNGIINARYENTMQRARNEIGARIEMNAQEYATLLAQGDTEGAAVARANLEGALRYRETLPGSTWGPEQSNMLLAGAEREAARMRDSARSNRQSEIGGMLSDIRRERYDGRVSAHEDILFTPEAREHPEYLATVAAVEFGNFMRGGFANMTSQERVNLIESERRRAVDDYDREMLGAMEAAHTRISEIERTDPVLAAQRRGVAIGTLDPSDPNTFARTLVQRRALADRMVEEGFATEDDVRIFTNAEREMLGGMIGESADPDTRLQVASALIITQGENVANALRELGAEESVAQLADVARVTSNENLLAEGLQGSAARQAGLARVGTANDMMDVADVAEIVTALPRNAAMRATVLEMSLDVLAGRVVQGQEPSEQQRLEALQAVVGRLGNYGGVQDVLGGSTLLPPTMTPRAIESAFDRFLTMPEMRVTDDGRIEVLGPEPAGAARRVQDREVVGTYDTQPEALASRFEGMPQGQPMIGGEPLGPSMARRGQLVPVVRNGEIRVGLYTMEFMDRNGNPIDVTDADGNLYVFDLNRMVR